MLDRLYVGKQFKDELLGVLKLGYQCNVKPVVKIDFNVNMYAMYTATLYLINK